MTEYYANGYQRPACMANLPDWALREFLARHAGPALEAAKDEAAHRGWQTKARARGLTHLPALGLVDHHQPTANGNRV